MKAPAYLRIASVLTLVHALLHTVGGVFGKPPGSIAAATYAVMQANSFSMMGAIRSYAQFLRGMGLAVSVFLVVESIVMWQLASLARTDGVRIRPIVATFLVGYLAMAVNSYAYFFLAPVIVEVLIAACMGMAIYTARPAMEAARANLAATSL